MIAKRVGAAVLALALIVGAWFVRDRVIEGNDSGTPGRPAQARQLYCVTELRDACKAAVAASKSDVELVVADADATLAELSRPDAGAVLWVTLDPFPDMITASRPQAEPLAITSQALAESPLALVVEADRAADVATGCPTLTWQCVGGLKALSPTFAPSRTAIGAVSIATALDQFGGPGGSLDDLDLLTWARSLQRSSQGSLSGGTAIATIQTRPSFSIAIGAQAELTKANESRFEVIYPVPMTSLDVVLASIGGASAPSGLTSSLTVALQAAGWSPATPAAAGEAGPPPAPFVLAALEYWNDL